MALEEYDERVVKGAVTLMCGQCNTLLLGTIEVRSVVTTVFNSWPCECAASPTFIKMIVESYV